MMATDAPAAFGRLCVETRPLAAETQSVAPAAFGRLCVETEIMPGLPHRESASRLRAAVC